MRRKLPSVNAERSTYHTDSIIEKRDYAGSNGKGKLEEQIEEKDGRVRAEEKQKPGARLGSREMKQDNGVAIVAGDHTRAEEARFSQVR